MLRHHKKLCLKCPPTSANEFVLECVYYNVIIKTEKKVIFVKEWFDPEILFVHQLVKEDGNHFTVGEFRTNVPVIVDTTLLVSCYILYVD